MTKCPINCIDCPVLKENERLKKRRLIRIIKEALIWAAFLAFVLWLCTGCVQSEQGMELDPAAVAPVAVQLFVPEPWKTIIWILLGSAVGGGAGGVIGRKAGKRNK